MNEVNSDIRLGWVAGIIEGEGWLGSTRFGTPKIQVLSTDEDIVRRLAAWSGVGTVAGPNRGPGKPTFRWNVSAREDAGQLLERILPLLGERRAVRAQEVIALWKAAPPKRGTALTCHLGHALSGSNLYLDHGRRRCRQCQNRRQRDCTARRRAVVG